MCNLPRTGFVPPPARPQAEACATQAYQRQRDVWASRLAPLLQEEASCPLTLHLQLQAVLQNLGYIPPTSIIDGVYGPATRSAISLWQIQNNLQPTGVLSASDVQLLLQAVSGGQRPVASALPARGINAARTPPQAAALMAATVATTSPAVDENALRASDERRLELSKAEAEKAQADAERARAEADIFAAKERAEAEARQNAAGQARVEPDAHGVQP